jgi:hypothetical protein
MDSITETRKGYNFRNTCYSCFNDIEFPILGDFAYGEILLQTEDAKEFYIAVLIDNPTFSFISHILEQNTSFKSNKIPPQQVLALIADRVNNKKLSPNYPVCPVCKSRLRSFGDNNRTTEIELGYASWKDFEKLSGEDKIKRLQQVLQD